MHMTTSDLLLIARKIVVGVLLTAGPFLLFFFAMRLLQHLL